MTTIVRGGGELIDELRPLWLAMVHHHAAVAPQLGPVHPDEETWARRRADYDEWLREDDAFVLVAREDDGTAVGYALVTVNPASPTWREPERAGLVESLSVLPAARGRGIGEALLERVAAELEAIGVHETRLSVVATNEAALRFYGRIGFEPHVVSLRRPRR